MKYCKDCDWYVSLGSNFGDCVYNPPIVAFTSDYIKTVFPQVSSSHYCRIVIEKYRKDK